MAKIAIVTDSNSGITQAEGKQLGVYVLPMPFDIDGQDVYKRQGLNRDMMVRILKEPKNAILRQYQKLLALDEVDLRFDDEALGVIADKAIAKKTGARALRSIIEEFMLDIMYEIPKDDNIGTVTITKAYIEGKGSPMITMRGTPALPDSPLANN